MNTADFTRQAARMVRRNDRRAHLLRLLRARRTPVARVPEQRRPGVTVARGRMAR